MQKYNIPLDKLENAEVVNILYFSKKEGKTKETKHVAYKSVISSKHPAFLGVNILIDTIAMDKGFCNKVLVDDAHR